jgi:hypothetical protein
MANIQKTVKVSHLVEQVNRMLKLSTCTDVERLVMCTVLEAVLHNTGNYAGYTYLDTEDGTPYAEGVTNTSRRHYYMPWGQ